jgi:hypothetical protein
MNKPFIGGFYGPIEQVLGALVKTTNKRRADESPLFLCHFAPYIHHRA